ncbi:MAG TPA: ATP-binding protein [Aggregatilineales bacterium]|nr:ATP-binding protein [Aggregatilineales bacterium]
MSEHPTAAEQESDSLVASSDADLAYRQALQYGRDLARIYVAERAQREKLEAAYQALKAVFASVPDAIVVLDDAFVVRQANAAFDALVNDSQTAVGQPLHSLLPSLEMMETLLRLSDEGESQPMTSTQLEIVIANPIKRSLLATCARMRSGQIGGWVITLHDQSERKRLDHQKAEFVNIASHELRTPLASVMGYTELLQQIGEDQLDEQSQEILAAILRGAKRLNGIVNELFQFAEMNGGHIMAGGVRTFNFAELLSDLFTDMRDQAGEHQVELHSDPAVSEVLVFGDESILRTALYQLVLNGIHFNRAGGYVRITTEQSEERLSIHIVDNGKGIAQAELETIFQPFFQVEAHEVRSVGGLGLGLAIARHAVEDLSGSLSVQSELGQGSSFTIEMPLKASEALNAVSQEETEQLESELESSQQQSLAYARDIQALYRKLQDANLRLKEFNVQLDEANNLKSSFLGLISHELRSPFVSIDFALQTFARYGTDHLKAEQRELLAQLDTSFKESRKMIDNLVAYAALLSKQGKLNLQPVALDQLVYETADVLRPMAENRGLVWQIADLPALLLPAGDRERLGEAIWHLLHNAIKFNVPGGTIRARIDQQDNWMVVSVEDTGKGISAEKQAKIWQDFSQAADPLKRGMEGLGLGLALVRSVAISHGGKVALQSEPGVGSIFSMWLPVRETTV